jgi:hypothetical protein
VHTGSSAQRATHDLNTRAWASGQHLVFANGAYGIHTAPARTRLAHELAHVLEQRRQPGRAVIIDREPPTPRDLHRLDSGKPMDGMDPLTGEFFDGHIDPDLTERYLRGLRQGQIYQPAAAPNLSTIPEKLSVAGCGKVTGGMDPAAAQVIRDCITHRRYVNIMAQSSANIAKVASTYSTGIASIYDNVIAKVVANAQVPTDTTPVDYTVTNLKVRVSAATTLPISTFTVTLAHIGLTAENGSWSALTNKLTLNQTSPSATVQDQADIERTMYHEMFHFFSDATNFAATKPAAGATPIREPALMTSLTAGYKTQFTAATKPVFDDMLTKVKLKSGAATSAFNSGQLAAAQWFRVENEMLSRVEEEIYLALRAGKGFTTADMRALPQEWLMGTPAYWDALGEFDRDDLAAYLKTKRRSLERDVLPIVQSVQERYMYLRSPS